MKNFIGHFRTITRHRHKVIAHCAKAGIFWQGLLHDLSKYSPTEFWQGVKYYQGTRSPNEGEREAYGYSLAWMHHKGRNKHHFEYWTDYYPPTKTVQPVKMPLRYVAEMFCDRVAASKVYMG
ncbi:MAG: catalase, partial [Oscillospiraceae bacterium]|nr:catalase [Oscillospiraceae bacterium]